MCVHTWIFILECFKQWKNFWMSCPLRWNCPLVDVPCALTHHHSDQWVDENPRWSGCDSFQGCFVSTYCPVRDWHVLYPLLSSFIHAYASCILFLLGFYQICWKSLRKLPSILLYRFIVLGVMFALHSLTASLNSLLRYSIAKSILKCFDLLMPHTFTVNSILVDVPSLPCALTHHHWDQWVDENPQWNTYMDDGSHRTWSYQITSEICDPIILTLHCLTLSPSPRKSKALVLKMWSVFDWCCSGEIIPFLFLDAFAHSTESEQ